MTKWYVNAYSKDFFKMKFDNILLTQSIKIWRKNFSLMIQYEKFVMMTNWGDRHIFISKKWQNMKFHFSI